MADTFVTVTNLTASDISAEGDNGIPSFDIPSAKSGLTPHVHVNISDLLGNVLLCETLGNWVTSGKITVVRNATALTEAILTGYAQGADMNRLTYDANDDGIVDVAATITAFTPRTQVVFADSPKTLDYTMDIIEVNTTGGAITLLLPTAIGHAGSGYRILDAAGTAGTSVITVDASGAQTIDGGLTAIINTPRGYLEIFSDGANWNSFNSDVRGLVRGFNPLHANVAFADSPYTAVATVEYLAVTTAGGAVTINLPTAVGIEGKIYTIMDTGGVAGTSAITVTPAAQTIDGAATVAINTNFGSLVIRSDGANWTSLNPNVRNLMRGFNPLHQNVAFADSPYTVLTTSSEIIVTTAGGAVTVNLPPAATAGEGKVYTIRDVGGVAATSAITVEGDAAETLDGAPNINIANNYGVLEIRSTGTAWTTKSSHERALAATSASESGYHVKAIALAVDTRSDESEITAVLNGSAGLRFIPTMIVMTVATSTGAPNGDATINIGTATQGAQISSALVTTGLVGVGTTRMVPLAVHSVSVAGNATLYVNIESADTKGASTQTLTVHILGYQI